jgi:signal transduction histidine kinase
MMLISFSTIYLITYKDVHREINMELGKISNSKGKQNEYQKEPRPNFEDADAPQKRSDSFTLTTDSEGVIVDTFSLLEMDDAFYTAAKTKAVTSGNDTGKFKLDDKYWTYIIKPYANGKRIVFLDITYRQQILINLIYTFVAVALVMLIVIFFISRFFANKSIKPIKEAFDKQKQFIGDASHELKTPLAVINTNVDVLLSNEEESIRSHSKWLHYIKSEVERMTKLTNDLLYLTQMDYSDVRMIYSNLNFSRTAEDVIMTMEAVIFENNISFDYDIEPNLKVNGNQEQLKQVIMILLDNALKYTNSKGRVNMTLKKHHNNIHLSVENTGAGIPEEHLGKIFDRFYRVDKSRTRNSGGYGLGLSIAKAIIEQHGGKISAKSTINESTTFTVELPSIG